MAIPAAALIQNPAQLDDLKSALISRQRQLKQFWRPLSLRQDYWANMYFLLDVIQQSKPLGVARRFVSNEPHTGPNAALSILTRNPIVWRIPLLGGEDENSEERRNVGRIERTLEGLVYDLDELFGMRLQMSLWKQIVFQALIRGMVWGKFQVSLEALKYRRSPLIAEIYDSRLVYPHVDMWGLNHVLIEKPTDLGDLVASYPGAYADFTERRDFDPHTPALKLEYWSNDRGDRKGIHAVLGTVGTAVSTSAFTGMVVGDTVGKDARWLIPPYFHGYTYDELPVVGVPVNGAHIQHKPTVLSPLEQRLQERADLLAMESLAWHGPASWVAEIGRSILSAVEEQVPQYNEMIATIFQHFTMETYPTWVFKTPTGELPEFHPGIGAMVPLTPQESVEKMIPQPISPDAYRLVNILQEERQKGILSNILQAQTPFSGTGVLFQQITHAALNAIEPYHTGAQQFGTRMGTSILAQLQRSADALGTFELQAPTPKKTFFRIEFDPKADLDRTRHYRPVPVIKPALPDDLTVRMTAARMALDPRRPILSLTTVLEDILQVDDPMAEIDRVWSDMAEQDPVLILEHMAQALERHGEMEMAARIRQNEFATRFVEETKLRQLTGNIPGRQGFTVPGPEAGPLSLSTARTGAEQPLPEQAAAAGVMGMTTGV